MDNEHHKLIDDIVDARDLALEKAWVALAGYKFWMFGYHASAWVKYNQLLPKEVRDPNPFKAQVQSARQELL